MSYFAFVSFIFLISVMLLFWHARVFRFVWQAVLQSVPVGKKYFFRCKVNSWLLLVLNIHFLCLLDHIGRSSNLSYRNLLFVRVKPPHSLLQCSRSVSLMMEHIQNVPGRCHRAASLQCHLAAWPKLLLIPYSIV